MYNLIERAIKIASIAHKRQKRKDDNIPYIFHPVSVGFILLKEGFDDKVVAAGILHDVLEDTNYSKKKMEKEVGRGVVRLVEWVTHNSSLTWQKKKEKYLQQLKKAPAKAKAIATADKIHNLRSFLTAYKTEGENLWKKFHGGKEKKIWFHEEAYKMLKYKWNHHLLVEYKKLINQLKKLK